MTGINYGPLVNPDSIREVRHRITARKEQKAAAPLKHRAQEATMRISKKIAEGSFATAKFLEPKENWVEMFALPVTLSALVVGTVSLGVQKIAESRFGKPIDLAKKKMDDFDYVTHFSKARIEKNVKRKVIDKPTGEILLTLKEMKKELDPKLKEAKKLVDEKQNLEAQLKKLEAGIINRSQKKEILEVNQRKSASIDNSPKITKLTNEIKGLLEEKDKIQKMQRENKGREEVIATEIDEINSKYATVLNEISLVIEEKREESDQYAQDKSLLKLEKGISKKYKTENGKISKDFFNDKYKAYVKRSNKNGEEIMDKGAYILKYYERKGITIE